MSELTILPEERKIQNALKTMFKESNGTLFAVSPGGEKFDYRGDMTFVALFEYEDHAAQYGKRMWPGAYEIHPISDIEIKKALEGS